MVMVLPGGEEEEEVMEEGAVLVEGGKLEDKEPCMEEGLLQE